MRCKACNNKLKEHEINWRKSLKIFEDLCIYCRYEVYKLDLQNQIADLPDEQFVEFIFSDEFTDG